MLYSTTTGKGNTGVSTESQELADAYAASMDAGGCTNCTNCTNCTYCRGCTDCTGCRGCTDCTYCRGCTDCTGCRGCTNCTNCTDCSDAMRWEGNPATTLLSLNGLRWPISTDGHSIQIGCQHHSIMQWQRDLTDSQIKEMAPGALPFWIQHKALVLALAYTRAAM